MQRGIVWVVDDDSSIRWVLERALAGAGLTCTTFENGAEVLEALASKTPDVLLSDIRMPGMDGLALLKQIKQRHPMLPVIIMTAHSDLDAAVAKEQESVVAMVGGKGLSLRSIQRYVKMHDLIDHGWINSILRRSVPALVIRLRFCRRTHKRNCWTIRSTNLR